MNHDLGTLRVTLAAAVGDDPALVAELRAAFLQSAATHVETLAAAPGAGDWQLAARRLQGLAASFGATALMAQADAAAAAPPGDPAALRGLRIALALLDR